MIYSVSAILHVGEAGLEYVDEYEDVKVINFEACGRNAVAVLGGATPPACVGRRVIIVDPDGTIQRRIEFFTRQPTTFQIGSDQEFRRLRFRIEQLGWTLR